MSALDNLRGTIRGLFPWTAHVSLSAKALIIGSATKLIELAGGGPGVARVGDSCQRLAFNATDGLFYLDAVPVPVYLGGPGPPPPGFGVAIVIKTGSEKVSCG